MGYIIADPEAQEALIARRQRRQIVMAIFLSFVIIAFTAALVMMISTANEMTVRHVSKFHEEYYVDIPAIMRSAWAALH